MIATDHAIDCLNSLLRGEIAATETYQQAIAKMDDTARAGDLRRMHFEHRDAANILREHVHAFGGKPDQDSGVWGVWAKCVEGTAKLFGENAALKALKEGEEQGVKDYEAALKDPGLSAQCHTLIHGRLLPQTREHIATLGQLDGQVTQRLMKAKTLRFGEGFRIVFGNRRAQAAEMTLAAGDSEGGPDNRHRGSDQWLYVVSGRGAAIVNKKRRPLRPGTLLLIAHGETHEIRNTGDEPLRTLNFYDPPAYTKDGEPLPRGSG